MVKIRSQSEVAVGSAQCSDRDARISDAVAEYLAACEAGARVDHSTILAKYADVADEVVGCLRTLEFVGEAAPELAVRDASEMNEVVPHLKTLGDFQICREIGRGGMGIVYEAEQLSMGRCVALKVLPFAALLDERQLQRFRIEARTAGTLHHPHIVPVFSVGTERGVHFYAMQFIDGPSLAEVLADLRECKSSPDTPNRSSKAHPFIAAPVEMKREFEPGDKNNACHDDLHTDTRRELQAALSTQRSNRRIDYFRLVARWAKQAAEGLAYAHENGVLHRDIKPANLLANRNGTILITDFGLARLESGASMTLTGDMVGTLRYMAPEQVQGKQVLVDHRADIYSLGITLYELATTESAFTGETREEIIHRVIAHDPIQPTKIDPTIPKDLETIILKAAAKTPEQRFQSANDMAEDLQRFLQHQPIVAKPPTVIDRVLKWTRRHQAVTWSVAIILVLTTIGLLLGLAWSRDKNRQLADAVQLSQRQTTAANKALARESAAFARAKIGKYRDANRTDRGATRRGDGNQEPLPGDDATSARGPTPG